MEEGRGFRIMGGKKKELLMNLQALIHSGKQL